jgi:hypothetical protein
MGKTYRIFTSGVYDPCEGATYARSFVLPLGEERSARGGRCRPTEVKGDGGVDLWRFVTDEWTSSYMIFLEVFIMNPGTGTDICEGAKRTEIDQTACYTDALSGGGLPRV